jgi:hypothetical protein
MEPISDIERISFEKISFDAAVAVVAAVTMMTGSPCGLQRRVRPIGCFHKPAQKS